MFFFEERKTMEKERKRTRMSGGDFGIKQRTT